MTTGSSRRTLVGLIGANIQQSISPALHEDAFAAIGMVGHYHLMDVDTLPGRTLPELLAAARTAGFAGTNVTFPFKEAVIPLLDEVSDEARQIGAVNTVVIGKDGRTTGHNTDRSGFRAAFLEAFGQDAARGKAVLQLGAGGAGRAVAFALRDLGRRAGVGDEVVLEDLHGVELRRGDGFELLAQRAAQGNRRDRGLHASPPSDRCAAAAAKVRFMRSMSGVRPEKCRKASTA